MGLFVFLKFYLWSYLFSISRVPMSRRSSLGWEVGFSKDSHMKSSVTWKEFLPDFAVRCRIKEGEGGVGASTFYI